ncbi:nuclease-related domain-containing protein [Edaphobacillus lindanitolerans]|uniref:Nuclease-related domain-containing protein n=1 Tax=Edaphobacillus lindanitolerans TaxID=550447 RepID=A0A1U7PNW1_9BACI|nr:nuclease-related domain-containing protein [Edaphobacillus lindanitolerans]SIT74700.1 Nuclease-related domain-containing protein [Edaphobacillus lindanitolerans]
MSIAVLHESAYDRALHRLAGKHRRVEEIERKKRVIGAGIAGEERVLSYLGTLDIKWPVLWDVNLEISPGHWVQIDVLVLLPAYAIIYEAKNIAGRLRFESNPAGLYKYDEHGQLTDRYDCPMLQLQDEMANLRIWLYQKNIPYSVDGAVVMTGSGIIEKPPARGKLFSLRELRADILGRTGSGGRTIGELWELADLLVRENIPFIPFPLFPRLGIGENEVYWGPVCEAGTCKGRLDRPTRRKWRCSQCGWKTPDPYTRTLEDWFLLKCRTITNAQVRELFGIGSTSASRLLSGYNLKKGGSGRSTYYYWDYMKPLMRG